MKPQNIGYLHPKKLIQPAQNSQTQVSNFEVALVLAVILFVGLVLFVPAANIFVGAFRNGWSGFARAVTSPEFLHAAKLSVMIDAIVVPVSVIFGIVTALAIARHQFPGRTLLLSIIDLPFSISPVVVGLMLVLLYGRQGWFGAALQSANIRILFAFPGMVLASAFVCMPFVAREVLPALEEIGTEQEEAAKTMGANDWQTFWRVTLPSIRWSLLYGILLTNARSMGEFGAVAVVSGNIIGKTQTLPLFVEEMHVQYQTTASYSAAVVLGSLSFVTLVFKKLLEAKKTK
ncbi:sulfate ABC transporter permease subunit CysW [Limnospira fusiformis KN01]|uniref:Sulfate/thiosulfate transporter subunit membrane component of ABC superfamily n=3 Tax=Limnospira TaxID=2596745 RepID=A0A9P1NYL4_9CYAN|nr:MULTISPECIES: sulfate ABC transporter permease subunit CysW [Limnospira]EKD06727.1 sulfate ABC transporter inner membrane subunit [Arthrospira platensis C1]KDR58301.1 sulfate transport system permease CysW [Arthrospira platensis str. Paraca]MDC0837113.1 sulfate ABC transporter permease subunit CysW [Limnoraphis robusta]MDT9310953.1 sulfate ABC transporter permease subunit CysW [Limnospira sp. Paracas R14]EDZ92290.1 sulfate ABC transporter, inner membrane subunit [Limnospira maxima CS-328]